MRAVLVVIANIVEEKSPQMAFVQSNNVIQQLPPTAFDPALRHPVGMSIQLRRMAMLRFDVSE
jgi:hypothetical protein